MFDRYEEAGDNKELTMVVVAASKFAQAGLSINSDQPTYSRKELEEQPVMADLNLYLEDIEFLLGKQANVKKYFWKHELMTADQTADLIVIGSGPAGQKRLFKVQRLGNRSS